MDSIVKQQLQGLNGFLVIFLFFGVSYHCCVKNILPINFDPLNDFTIKITLSETIVNSRQFSILAIGVVTGFIDYDFIATKLQFEKLDGTILLIRYFLKQLIPIWFSIILMFSLPGMVSKSLDKKILFHSIIGSSAFVGQYDTFSLPLAFNSLVFNCFDALVLVIAFHNFFNQKTEVALQNLQVILVFASLIIEFYSYNNGIWGAFNRQFLYYFVAYLLGIRVSQKLRPFEIEKTNINNSFIKPQLHGIFRFVENQMNNNKVFGDVMTSTLSTIPVILCILGVPLDGNYINSRQNSSIIIFLTWLNKLVYIYSVAYSTGFITMNKNVVYKHVFTIPLLVRTGRNLSYYHPICLIVYYVILRFSNNVQIGPFSLIPMILILIFTITCVIFAGDLTSLMISPFIERIDHFIESKYDQKKQKKMADRIRAKLQAQK